MSEINRKRSEISYSTIGKVRQILDCFTFHKPSLTVYQIAQKVNIPTSSLYRYLQTMVSAGLLTYSKQNNSYSVGMSIIELAGISLMQYDIRYASLPEMTVLNAKTDMNVNLSILDECDVVHLAYSITYYVTPWVDAIGRRAVSYQTAMGMSMLAYLPEEDVELLIRQAHQSNPEAYPLPDFDKLLADFEEIRNDGAAVMYHPFGPSIECACLACPIRRKNGEVCASISINWYREHNSDSYITLFKQAKPLLLQTAAKISYKLGYVGKAYGTPI